MSLTYDYEYFDHALNGTSEAPNPKNELTQFRTTQLQATYGFSDRLQMSAWIPYRQIVAPKTNNPDDPATRERFTRRFSGLGDVIAMGFYDVVPARSGGSLSFTAGAGVRLPTGASNPDHEWVGSLSRDPVLQPGSGTLDPIVAGLFGVTVGKTRFNANALARISGGESIYEYRYANEYQAGIGATRSMSDWLDLKIAANGIFTGHDSDKGVRVENTGGTWLYVSPGITVRSGLINTSMSMQIPIHQNVNESQLVSDYVFTIGMSCGLDLGGGSKSTSSSTPHFAPSRGGGGSASHPEADIETISLGEPVMLGEFLVSGKYTIFEFYSDRCSACAAVEPHLRSLAAENSRVAVRKINIGFGDSPVVTQYEIEATPTMIVFDPSGQQVFKEAVTDLGPVRSLIE